MATVLYMIGGAMLMINMLGYFLGKYPQHFDLDDDQRTLILQTMMFFFWLAGGAAIFSKVCGWAYADALYFCDVTVLTIGFGDFTSTSDAGRGIVFPYSVIGIIFLGLMISSIRKFAISMSKDKISRAHEMNERARTFGRSVTSEKELRDRLGLPPRSSTEPRKLSSVQKPPLVGLKPRTSLEQYGHLEMHGRSLIFHEHHQAPIWVSGRGGAARTFNHSSKGKALSRDEKLKARKDANTPRQRRASRRQKLLLLTKEKDRFNAMRDIQHHTHKFRQYYALAMSTLAFSILWCVGALVFMFAERREQNLTYFESLYFCYVSLLTIGYGDFSPRSNAGKSFFVVWSLIAIPTMTILVSDMGETVVSAINRGTFTLADVTVMPKVGIWHDFLENHPAIKAWLAEKNQQFEERKRLKHGFTVADPDLESNTIANSSLEANKITIEDLAKESLNEHDLARKLAKAIKRVAQDIHADVPVKYRYEEWVEFTRLIRFSAKSEMEVEMEEEEGLIEWDWIGEDSPMLSDAGEPQWILDRLCESLNRYTRRQAIKVNVNLHTTLLGWA
jgi:potassium channel subfamily K